MAKSQISIEDSEVTIEVADQNIRVMAIEQPTVLVLGESGPQGPSGGVQISDLSYVYVQNVSSNTWTIVHGLQFIPNITVVDSAGSVVEGDYSYPDENTVIATFAGGFTGKAYLS
jgi:hypothetical protein